MEEDTSGARWWEGIEFQARRWRGVIIILVVERSEASATYGNDGTNSCGAPLLRGQCSELLWLAPRQSNH